MMGTAWAWMADRPVERPLKRGLPPRSVAGCGGRIGRRRTEDLGNGRALARQVTTHGAFVDDLLFLDLKGRVAKRLLQLVSPSLGELPRKVPWCRPS